MRAYRTLWPRTAHAWRLCILEAGCGSNSAFRFPQNVHIIGLDVSERQLQLNEKLAERHLGDVQSYVFPPNCFDMIVCWNVLEHLQEPEKALRNFATWLAPGGIMILALPNVLSTSGLATKFSPHWLHVWWYRNVGRNPDAGKNGRGPFKTFLAWSISMPRLRQFAAEHDLSVLFAKRYPTYGGGKARTRRLRLLFSLASVPVTVVTLGGISAFKDAMMLVLQRANSD